MARASSGSWSSNNRPSVSPTALTDGLARFAAHPSLSSRRPRQILLAFDLDLGSPETMSGLRAPLGAPTSARSQPQTRRSACFAALEMYLVPAPQRTAPLSENW